MYRTRAISDRGYYCFQAGWPHGVLVLSVDCQAADRGSNPDRRMLLVPDEK